MKYTNITIVFAFSCALLSFANNSLAKEDNNPAPVCQELKNNDPCWPKLQTWLQNKWAQYNPTMEGSPSKEKLAIKILAVTDPLGKEPLNLDQPGITHSVRAMVKHLRKKKEDSKK